MEIPTEPHLVPLLLDNTWLGQPYFACFGLYETRLDMHREDDSPSPQTWMDFFPLFGCINWCWQHVLWQPWVALSSILEYSTIHTTTITGFGYPTASFPTLKSFFLFTSNSLSELTA